MRSLTKALIASGAVLVALTLSAAVWIVVDRSDNPDPKSLQVERADSHVLDPGDSDAVSIVEFLDFECEACAAYHPVVEDVREKYEGEIRFVVRYFPLPGHPNSGTAAVAAEAAAQQGRFEDMHRLLFERQAQWSHTTQSRAPMFRDYAAELGLDLAAYDDAVADPATQARVRADFDEGRALGVGSTPTFFIDGEPLTIQRWGDLETAILDARRD